MSKDEGSFDEFMTGMRLILGAFRSILRIGQGSSRKEAIGTAFVVAHGSKRHVITAEHVLAGPEDKLLGIDESGSIRLPRKYSRLVALEPNAAQADVAWTTFEPPNDVAALGTAIPFELASAATDIVPGVAYVAVGQPTSKSKLVDAQNALSSSVMMAFVEPAPPFVVDAIGIDRDVQFAFSYPPDTAAKVSKGAPRPARPRGMSGGAIVATARVSIGAGRTRMIPIIIGVLTEFYDEHQTFVATRIEHFWAAQGVGQCFAHPLFAHGVSTFDKLT